jgi:hypothetical protein
MHNIQIAHHTTHEASFLQRQESHPSHLTPENPYVNIQPQKNHVNPVNPINHGSDKNQQHPPTYALVMKTAKIK